jgi:hypothetical protein
MARDIPGVERRKQASREIPASLKAEVLAKLRKEAGFC